MPASKKTMLTSRLQKRLRALGLHSFKDYCDYLFSPGGVEHELIHMIDLTTTNKTDFFRESTHFDFLVQTAVPDLLKNSGSGVRKPLSIWSAGCSTGEEPYTLCMVLHEFAQRFPGLDFGYSILATDISSRVLETARRGIYSEERVEPIPVELRRRYLLRSKDKRNGLVRIVPELREHVHFRRVNFMDEDFGFRENFDIIFCRNVIIYFDKETQERLFRKFASYMNVGSYLFIGHSETLSGFDVPLTKVAPTIYRKT